MKIYIQTDMEGVAGVMNVNDYLSPGGRCYQKACRLLTEEVNAAVRGLAEGGFDQIVVADGHGAGGIDIELLDNRAHLMRGWPTRWPLLLDKTYDAVAFVGQHAKAGTEHAHIPHTQWWNYLDLSVNGISIGEYGQFVLCANEMDIPVILGTGDVAFCREAKALTPWVETVETKQGTTPGTGDELESDAYSHSHETAVHLHPEVVRRRIEEAALAAARRMAGQPGSFGRVEMEPPYRLVVQFRRRRGQPPQRVQQEHPASVAGALNMV